MVGRSSHVVRLGPSLLGWVRRGEPCPSSGNSLCYLPTDGKCSMHSANVHWVPATMPGSAGTGGYTGEEGSPGLCPHRARITAWAPQESHSELSVNPRRPWSLISYQEKKHRFGHDWSVRGSQEGPLAKDPVPSSLSFLGTTQPGSRGLEAGEKLAETGNGPTPNSSSSPSTHATDDLTSPLQPKGEKAHALSSFPLGFSSKCSQGSKVTLVFKHNP